MKRMSVALPIVLVPVGADEEALDACLAALEAATPAGTRVWLADDAQTTSRSQLIIQRWLARTRLQAEHTRRRAPLGEAAHLAQALQACAEQDVVVLAGDARPTPGWLESMTACLATDPTIATVTPWCNAGELVAWPRMGEIVPLEVLPSQLAQACTQLPQHAVDVPVAVPHAVLLRGGALPQVGGVDGISYHSWAAALIDLSLRLAGLGWRNVLCPNAFVLRTCESLLTPGDGEVLAARWPAWHARIADCLMRDPLRPLRQQLQAALAGLVQRSPQADLFAEGV